MSSQEVAREQKERPARSPLAALEFSRGNFDDTALVRRRVPGYVIAQLLGSALAILHLWWIFCKVGMLCATEPGPGISEWLSIMITFAESSAIIIDSSSNCNQPCAALIRLCTPASGPPA